MSQVSPEKNDNQTESPEVTRERRMDYGLISAIAISIISLCALFVSVYQTRILSEQNRMMTQAAKAQLWPRIQMKVSGEWTEAGIIKTEAKLKNVGTGPAIIEDFAIEYRDSVFTSWWDMYEMLPIPDSISGMDISMLNANPNQVVLQAGESYNIFRLLPSRPELIQDAMQVFYSDDGPKVHLCYRSVFDDYWSLSGRYRSTLLPQPINGEQCNNY